MRLKFQGGSDETVKFVKGILPMIGNIREFEVYGSFDATPYSVVEDGVRVGYPFVLRDDQGTDLWLGTLCGFGGSGPQATREILQLLGLKADYGIFDKKQVKATGLQPVHHMNLLVGSWDLSTGFSGRFWASMQFKYARQLHPAKAAIRCLGPMQPAAQVRNVDIPEEFQAEAGDDEFADHFTNLALMLNLP